MKQGKKAIVVGASSGIGLEVAKCLIQQGWKVGVAARRVELLQDLGAAAIERIDVTADDATEGLQRMITKLGGMDLYRHIRPRKPCRTCISRLWNSRHIRVGLISALPISDLALLVFT